MVAFIGCLFGGLLLTRLLIAWTKGVAIQQREHRGRQAVNAQELALKLAIHSLPTKIYGSQTSGSPSMPSEDDERATSSSRTARTATGTAIDSSSSGSACAALTDPPSVNRLNGSCADGAEASEAEANERANEQLECAICLGLFVIDEELRTLPCGHDFHRDCVDEWLLGKGRRTHDQLPSCPLCKAVPLPAPLAPIMVWTRPTATPEGGTGTSTVAGAGGRRSRIAPNVLRTARIAPVTSSVS